MLCSHLKCCFNLFGPKLYDGDNCPSNCRGLTKSNKVLKKAAYYREQAAAAKINLPGVDNSGPRGGPGKKKAVKQLKRSADNGSRDGDEDSRSTSSVPGAKKAKVTKEPQAVPEIDEDSDSNTQDLMVINTDDSQDNEKNAEQEPERKVDSQNSKTFFLFFERKEGQTGQKEL